MIVEIMGTIGLILLLLGYIFSKKKLRSAWLNFIGSVILAVYGYMFGAWAIVILDSIWAVISFRNIIYYRNWGNELDDE